GLIPAWMRDLASTSRSWQPALPAGVRANTGQLQPNKATMPVINRVKKYFLKWAKHKPAIREGFQRSVRSGFRLSCSFEPECNNGNTRARGMGSQQRCLR